MFKQLFLQRLLSSVQTVLAPNIPSSSVQMLAETADRILDYYRPTVTVNVASRLTTAQTVPTIENAMKRLDDLTLEVSHLHASHVSRRRTADAFEHVKETLSDTTAVSHLLTGAPLSIVVVTSICAIDAAL
nr:unnamed protein product [Spirometra erinaceieuropaei]